ncbi:MAG: D-alanyl-D-alanine carboxypeptidase family protein [Janthinobacterium lividum]
MNHRFWQFSLFLTCSYSLTAAAIPNPAGTMIPSPPQLSAKAWVLMDATSANVITEQNSEEHLPPASLTKLMTVYVATNEIQAQRLKPDDLVTISENAWKTGGSRMFLDPRSQVSVQDLLKGIVIDSGNDASVALSEHIAGSEDAFAGVMNSTAQRLAMTHTHFMNPTGLPDPEHYSSAQDMATLARAIITDESAYYPLYAHKYFTWNGIRQPNRNLLLWRDPSVDGLKTGHTEAAGYCMVTSAVRNGTRLIAVVFGSTTLENRAADTQKLLTYGFRFFDTQTYEKAGQVLGQPRLWKGQDDTLKVGLLHDMTLTLPKNPSRKVSTRLQLNEPLLAPLAAGASVGTLELLDGDQVLSTQPLVALQPAEAGGWWTVAWDSMKLFFVGLLGG